VQVGTRATQHHDADGDEDEGEQGSDVDQLGELGERHE
jgi:hypothetical protein